MKKDALTIVFFILFFVGIWYFVYYAEADKNTTSEDYVVNTEKGDTNLPKDPNWNEEENIINTNDTKQMTKATLNTNMGEIEIEFYEKEAPNTVANFKKLSSDGFYNGIKFHRVIKGFMNQAGDPLSKDDTKSDYWGTGGPGYKFADEIDAQSDLYTKIGYKNGVVAMANSGPNTNGSQFFIMAADYPLPPLYTIFGHVTKGLDVVEKINNTSTNASDRPLQPVIIESITLK